MPIPEAELEKYHEDAIGFLTEIGARLKDINCFRRGSVKITSQPPKPPFKAYMAVGEIVGENLDFPEGYENFEDTIYMQIGIKEENMGPELIREIPADIGLDIELTQTDYDINHIRIKADLDDLDMHLEGRTFDIYPLTETGKIDFFKDKIEPAVKEHGFVLSERLKKEIADYEAGKGEEVP